MMTSEEIRLAKLIRAKREELLRRREQEVLLQQQLEANATRAMPIKVITANKPEPPRAEAPTGANGADGASKEAPREVRKREVEGEGEDEVKTEAWSFKRKTVAVSASAARVPSDAEAKPTDEVAAAVAPDTGSDSAPVAHKYMTKKRRAIPREELDDTVFPAEHLLLSADWNPSLSRLDAGLGKDFILADWGPEKNQTLALKVSVPADSTRWAVNICPPEHDRWKEMVFHFNPRRFKREELLLNSRTEGIWRKNDTLPLSDLPALFGSNSRECTIELVIQVRAQGFFVFHNRNYLCHFPHRREVGSFGLDESTIVIELASPC